MKHQTVMHHVMGVKSLTAVTFRFQSDVCIYTGGEISSDDVFQFPTIVGASPRSQCIAFLYSRYNNEHFVLFEQVENPCSWHLNVEQSSRECVQMEAMRGRRSFCHRGSTATLYIMAVLSIL